MVIESLDQFCLFLFADLLVQPAASRVKGCSGNAARKLLILESINNTKEYNRLQVRTAMQPQKLYMNKYINIS